MEATHVQQPLHFVSTIGRSFAEAAEKTVEALTGWLGLAEFALDIEIELTQAEVEADLGYGRSD